MDLDFDIHPLEKLKRLVGYTEDIKETKTDTGVFPDITERKKHTAYKNWKILVKFIFHR